MPTNQRPITPMATPNDARTSTPTHAIASANPKTLTVNQVKRALFAAAEKIHGPLKGRR